MYDAGPEKAKPSQIEPKDHCYKTMIGFDDHKVIKLFEPTDAINIATKIQQRQTRFDEPLHTSITMVLMNCGEEMVEVVCAGDEWSGTKKDVIVQGDIPKCPNGHVLYETTHAPRLALVQEGNTNA